MNGKENLQLIVGDKVTSKTPEDVAELFASMGSDEQARFFNHVDAVASCWGGGGLPFQLQSVTEDDGLTLEGRRVMQMIGKCSHGGSARYIMDGVMHDSDRIDAPFGDS